MGQGGEGRDVLLHPSPTFREEAARRRAGGMDGVMMQVEVQHALYMRLLRASKRRLGDAAAFFPDETLVYLYVRTALQEAVDRDER